MDRFKKTLRLSGLIILIFLASIGCSIGGGVPVPPSNKKDDETEIKTELVEANEDTTR